MWFLFWDSPITRMYNPLYPSFSMASDPNLCALSRAASLKSLYCFRPWANPINGLVIRLLLVLPTKTEEATIKINEMSAVPKSLILRFFTSVCEEKLCAVSLFETSWSIRCLPTDLASIIIKQRIKREAMTKRSDELTVIFSFK